MAAVRAGDDVVARDALLRKRQCELEAEQFRGAEQREHEAGQRLTRALVTLNFRIEEAKHKRNAVLARGHGEEAHRALRDIAEEAPAADPQDLVARLEAKMSTIETELELSDESIANLTRDAAASLAAEADLARHKRALDALPAASKPLAKTLPSDASVLRGPDAQAAGSSTPPRTKR
jgi:phage shock protein A